MKKISNLEIVRSFLALDYRISSFFCCKPIFNTQLQVKKYIKTEFKKVKKQMQLIIL